MTRDEFKQLCEIRDRDFIIDMLYTKTFENDCSYCEFNKDDICVNDESPMLADFVSKRLWCEEFNGKDKK